MMKKILMFLVLIMGIHPMMAQDKTVTGTVTDANDGMPLPGVNVLVQGSTTGTQSDFDGNYTIEASTGDVLIFSFIGMKSQNVTVGANNTIDLAMQEDASQLDEVVVTALGIKKSKKAVTYSTQDVSTDELTQARSINVVNGLSGKVAGLSVTTGSSGVGSSSKVLLRGNRSISGSSQPLYVVDGIILNGDISNMSPDDIEDISVLKGANAAALYGSRAANGAIIVTTKSGSNAEEGVTTSLNFTATSETANFLAEYQNVYGQGSGGVYTPSATSSWGPEMNGQNVAHWSNDPNYPVSEYAFTAQPNNVKDFFRTGVNLTSNISVNINNEKSNTFLSYTNTDAEGIMPNNDLTSHNLSARSNVKITDRLSLDTKLNYIKQEFSNVLTTGEDFENPLRYAYILPRNIRSSDIQHYEFTDNAGLLKQHYYLPDFNGGGNPYWQSYNVTKPRTVERVIGLLSLKYQITDNLSLMGRSALDRSNIDEEQKWYIDTYTQAPNGKYVRRSDTSYEWNTDALLNYNKDITDWLGLDFNLGANARKFKSTGVRGEGSNFQVPNLFALENTSIQKLEDFYSEKSVHSIYSFAELSFLGAIYLSASARNDWSSTLPEENNSYFYPAFGLTTVLTDLIEFPEAITYLKLRGSWAEVGNDTSPYQLSRSTSIENSSAINFSNTEPNASLKPETTRSLEVGADLRLFNNRLRLDATYYRSNTYDQLFQSPVSSGYGYTSVFENGGDIQNDGVEIVFGATVVETENFSWDLNLNFAKNNSLVTRISEDRDQLDQGTDFVRTYRLKVGEPFGEVYSRGFLRDDNGNVIVDETGIPQSTTGLDVRVANYNPDWLGGISNTFKYKNFSLSTLIDIRQGGTILAFTDAILAADGLPDFTLQGRDGGLVFGENIFANETAVTTTGQTNTTSVDAETLWRRIGGRSAPIGEAFVRDASNIRLREVVLGYTFPKELIDRTFLSSARLSLVGRNLFFLSNKAETFDPEAITSVENNTASSNNEEFNSEGREAFAPPTTRSFGFSLNLSF
ncbi:SusC/RagA family TonB-linked outer membrane protein [Zobellia amurskyensis]|nr:SusC/RagA family TonB-linked outer membrane protein [Zobellia amurskyensis]